MTNATIAISIMVNPVSDDRICWLRLSRAALNERCASRSLSTANDGL